MPRIQLEHFLGAINTSYLSHMIEAEKRMQWNSLSIRKEGREIEIAQLQKLFGTLLDVHKQSVFSDPTTQSRLGILCAAEVFEKTSVPTDNDNLLNHVGNSANVLLDREVFFKFPQIDWNVPLSLEDGVALRNFLELKRHFLLYAPDILELWSDRFVAMWEALFTHFPDQTFISPASHDDALSLSTPLLDIMNKPALAIEHLLGSFGHEDMITHKLFDQLRRATERNILFASNIPFEERDISRKPIITPTKSREPAHLLPELYLADTPFLPVFFQEIPVEVPEQVRFEHTHLVAGTGHGKTQLLQYLITKDLPKVASGKASIIVIDSQGDLIDNILKLAEFAPGGTLVDRLVLIDPTDVEYPVALNMFDMNTDHENPLQQEKLLNGVLELYDFIFGSLLGAELTQKQGVIFRYVARLMLKVPGATIQHLHRLMEPDGYEEFSQYVDDLDSPTAKAFFETDFQSREFDATKKQVRRRLWGVLENKTFENMFSYPKSKLNLAKEMNAGKVILINTSKDLLKQTGTEIFGRFFLALITQAALERATQGTSERMPTFVYIDEANDYFQKGDENLPLILEQARKYKISMTLAHQYLDQLDNKLKSSLSANTSTKIIGGASQKDALSFAKEMNCDTAMIEKMRKFKTHSEFAIWVKNVTFGAMRLRVPFGVMENMPHMTDDQFQHVRDRQRQLYSVTATSVKKTLSGEGDLQTLKEAIDAIDDDLDVATTSGWKPSENPQSKPVAKPKDQRSAEKSPLIEIVSEDS